MSLWKYSLLVLKKKLEKRKVELFLENKIKSETNLKFV